MAKNHLPWLVLAASGLSALFWWDYQARTGHSSQKTAIRRVDTDRPRESAPPGDPNRATVAPAFPASDGHLNPLAALDMDALAEMVARPLFAPGRRRPPPMAPAEAAMPAAAPSAAPAPPPPSYALLGVIRDGDRSIALLRRQSDGRNFRVEPGDVIGGARITAVGATSVTLTRGDGTSQEMGLLKP